jgi:hypothetical protein
VPLNESSSAFGYQQILWQPQPLPNIYAAVNTNTINNPGGAFGSTFYKPNTFVEFAVDLTDVIGGAVFPIPDQCDPTQIPNMLLPFKTVWIKSKSSASPDASLVDFLDPVQINVDYLPTTTVLASFIYFDLQSGQFEITVSPGINDDYTFNWASMGAYDNSTNTLDTNVRGTLDNYHISNPIFTANPNYICYSYVWQFSVKRKSDLCFVGGGRIRLPSLCERIGKPINPDQMQQGEVLLEENISTNHEIRIFPNPAKGSATVTLTGENSVKDITLIDMKGAVVLRWTGVSTNTLQLKDLSSGLYLLKVFSKATGKTVTKKIIVDN